MKRRDVKLSTRAKNVNVNYSQVIKIHAAHTAEKKMLNV